MKSGRAPGIGQATAVAAMVAAGLGAIAVVGGSAILVSAADATPLLVATAALLAAGTSGWLLSLASVTIRRLRADRLANDESLALANSTQPASALIVEANGQQLAVLDLGEAVSAALRKDLDQRLLETGRPFLSGGPLAPESLSLAGIAPPLAARLRDGNVFKILEPGKVRSAGRLMKMGKGFGSAIVGPTGKIVGHARFVPAGTMVPVAVPILLLTTFSSMMMSVRFDRIEKALGLMATALDYALKDKLSEDMARFLSASERLSDIGEEYKAGPGFTAEMKTRLAHVERDISVLRHKHHALATAKVDDELAARLSENSKRLFVASSIADAQVERLRLALALQDNPADVARRRSALEDKVERHMDSFRSLVENNPKDKLKERLQKSLDEMGRLERLIRRGEVKAKEAEIRKLDHLASQVASTAGTEVQRDAVDPAKHYSIFIWRDSHGSGALKGWYSDDYRFQSTQES